MTINSSSEIEYGRVGNGLQVGSGFDVTVRRESHHTALVNVIDLASKTEWLGAVDVEPTDNLQELAKEIGNCPGPWVHGFACDDPESDDDWDDMAARWNLLEVR